MKKKIFVSLIAIFFIITNLNTASSSQKFKDVSNNYWAKAEIEYLAEQGIINGYSNGNFGLNDPITRLQASIMIIRALNLDTSNRPHPSFIDVSPSDFGYSIIATIADEGIILGNGKGEFKPHDSLTRGQMAAVLVRAFELKGETSYSFRDVSGTHWASKSIKTLTANNITTGFIDNTFRPNDPINRSQFAVFMARVLNPNYKSTISCYKPNNDKRYVVNVTATTLWVEPNKNRTLDQSSLSYPVDLEKWTKSMSVKQKLWLVGKLETQALYGQEVSILQSRGDWYQIAVHDQSTPKNKNGYPGWVPKSHISEYYPNYQTCKVAIVDTKITTLYSESALKSKFLDISFNTRLPVIKADENWIQVQTPLHQTKYLKKQDVTIYDNEKAIAKPSQGDIVNTAKKFIGLPYLWAGTSGFGFDCSGFTHTIYKRHGIFIPRDASAQFNQGTVISKSNMQAGDLLFFAYNNGKGRVHHVSMYIGNGQMIHSPNSRSSVEIVSINTEPYKSEFVGAKRYIN